MRIYQDSKELTAYIYDRIEVTGDYRYMIKGYEIGDEIKCNIEELETKFNEIIQDYVIAINSKSLDFENYGKLTAAVNQKEAFVFIISVIDEQIKINKLCKLVDRKPIDFVSNLLSDIKIKKSKDLNRQKAIIEERLSKLENEILDLSNKLQPKNEDNDKGDKMSMSEIIVGLNVVLSINIDMHKTSIFQIGKYMEMAQKKNEQLIKSNGR